MTGISGVILTEAKLAFHTPSAAGAAVAEPAVTRHSTRSNEVVFIGPSANAFLGAGSLIRRARVLSRLTKPRGPARVELRSRRPDVEDAAPHGETPAESKRHCRGERVEPDRVRDNPGPWHAARLREQFFRPAGPR